VLTIGYLDGEGELVYDGVDSDDEVDGLVQDGGLDEDEKEWDYPEEEEEEEEGGHGEEEDEEEEEAGWGDGDAGVTRAKARSGGGGQLSDDEGDVEVYAESMYGDREKYQYSAYMSDSDGSDIEADPEYQEHMRNLYGAAEDGTPCMCGSGMGLSCPQHTPLVGAWQPRG